MSTFQVLVESVCLQGQRNLAITLIDQQGDKLPEWQPGAHIDLHLAPGLIRQYSLTGSATDRYSYQICVSRDANSRGGSNYIHDKLRPGQTIKVSEPRNHFPLQPAAKIILIAGGIGITPLYAMALALEQQAIPFSLHYYTRQPEDAAYKKSLLAGWQYGNISLWSSSAGISPREHLADELLHFSPGTLVYLCGPEAFMHYQKQCALQHGFPESAIFTEAFKPASVESRQGGDDIFTVTLASSGQQWPVPAEKTIAQVLIDNGVDVPLSCEMGMCGACLTGVAAGQPDHRDTVQSESEKTAGVQQIALCCSRSFSKELILDL